VETAVESNCELKRLSEEQNEELLIARNEISSLRQELVELSSKSLSTQNMTNDKDLQISQFNKENQLVLLFFIILIVLSNALYYLINWYFKQKQEIIRLKELLEESRQEKKWLISLLTETNVDLISIYDKNYSENQTLPPSVEEEENNFN